MQSSLRKIARVIANRRTRCCSRVLEPAHSRSIGDRKGCESRSGSLGGTLHLDIAGHNLPEQKTHDIQPLRSDRGTRHRFEKVNSSHHQAIDKLGAGLEVESWCATDDIVEQVRLRDYPFALGVQYHPERGKIYDELFDDFISQVRGVESLNREP